MTTLMHSSDRLRVRGYAFPSNSFNVDQCIQVENRPHETPQLILRSQVPEISKCTIHMQLLAHWEALGEVSVLS